MAGDTHSSSLPQPQVSYMTRTRGALVHSHEDNDLEEDGGPNSYPVYLMEQQTLGVGQIPSPR